MMRAVCGENIYYSLNLIGWGMATDISVLAEKLRFFGGQRYNIASVFEIIKNKRRDSKLIIDGKERDGAYSFIIACNTKYVGKDMKMAPKAKIDDGEIDLIIVKKTSSFTLFSVFPKFRKQHCEWTDDENVRRFVQFVFFRACLKMPLVDAQNSS